MRPGPREPTPGERHHKRRRVVADALNRGRILETAALREVLLCQPTRGKGGNIPETKTNNADANEELWSGSGRFPRENSKFSCRHPSEPSAICRHGDGDQYSTPPPHPHPLTNPLYATLHSIPYEHPWNVCDREKEEFIHHLCPGAPMSAGAARSPLSHTPLLSHAQERPSHQQPPPPPPFPHLSATLTNLPLFLRCSPPLLHRPPPLCPICPPPAPPPLPTLAFSLNM